MLPACGRHWGQSREHIYTLFLMVLTFSLITTGLITTTHLRHFLKELLGQVCFLKLCYSADIENIIVVAKRGRQERYGVGVWG